MFSKHYLFFGGDVGLAGFFGSGIGRGGTCPLSLAGLRGGFLGDMGPPFLLSMSESCRKAGREDSPAVGTRAGTPRRGCWRGPVLGERLLAPAAGGIVGAVIFNPPGPPRHKPAPNNSRELHVHPQRDCTIDCAEQRLVCIFLERYIVWLARRRRVDDVRNALGLLFEVAGARVRSPI
jgi:hypothetical protein